MKIAAETPADLPAVRAINRQAFGRDGEADLVDGLRAEGSAVTSLLAFDEALPVGHVMFSRIELEVEGNAVRAAALAPVAVLPSHQSRGAGKALIEAGHALLRSQNYGAVIVLGHETYYPRFGYCHDLVSRIACPFTAYPAFMGLELKPGSLAGKSGWCRYPAAFGLG